MKAIILVAGRGLRFGDITKDLPKCLLQVHGKSILERQLELLRRKGINEIVVVKGFAAEKINLPDVKYIVDEKHCYDKVFSLMEAKDELFGDTLIIYGDILYDESVIDKVLNNSEADIEVVVDKRWYKYFAKRYGDPLADTVSLEVSDNNDIIKIGQNNPALNFDDIYGQFIGFLKLSHEGCKIFKNTYLNSRNKFWNKEWINGRIFQKVRTTDFLQIIINSGYNVKAIPIENGWLEFDDINDLNLVNKYLSQIELDKLCKLY